MSSQAASALSGMTLKDLLKNPDLQHALAKLNSAPVGLKAKKSDEAAETDFMSAFLGPQLWDKTSNSSEFNLEYMDLDEFLCENPNEIPDVETVSWDELASVSPPRHSALPRKTHSPHLSPSPNTSSDQYAVLSARVGPSPQFGFSPPSSPGSATLAVASSIHPTADVSPVASRMVFRATAGVSKDSVQETGSARCVFPEAALSGSTPPLSPHTVQVDFPLSEQDLVLSSIPGESAFDPTSHTFTEDELKPQPMVKKSKKMFVPEDLKDDRYWVRRKKNNVAAKRSRDARRVKENQIAMRAAYLERENETIQDEIEKIHSENARLKYRLKKYEPSG